MNAALLSLSSYAVMTDQKPASTNSEHSQTVNLLVFFMAHLPPAPGTANKRRKKT